MGNRLVSEVTKRCRDPHVVVYPWSHGFTAGVMAVSRWQDALWSRSSVRGVWASDVITDTGCFADFVLGTDLLLLHSFIAPALWIE